jgi:hypothetical protein
MNKDTSQVQRLANACDAVALKALKAGSASRNVSAEASAILAAAIFTAAIANNDLKEDLLKES